MLLTKLTKILVTLLQFLNPLNDWDGVCNTIACQNAARRITFDINPHVSPCDNFYQFACGNFMRGMNMGGKSSRVGMMQYEIDGQMMNLLQEKPKRFEPRIFRSVKRFFQMCMDEEKIDDRGVAPGVEMLKKLGGWPVLGNWDPAGWSILEIAINSWHLGFDVHKLMKIRIAVDLADITKRVFKVEQPDMPIPRGYLIRGENNPVVKEYFRYMMDMATMFGAESQTAEKAMREVLQLQIELAEIVTPEEKRRGIQQNLKQFTIKELDKDPNKLLDWRKLFEGIVSPNKLKDDQKIYFYDLEVIQRILALLNRYPAEIIANHVMWSFALQLSPYLTTAMRIQDQRLEQVLHGLPRRKPRWQECMAEVNGLTLALSAIYVNKFFDKSSRKKAKALTNEIQSEMDKLLLEADWMDEKTRKTAQKKSAKMLHVIGYPDELANMRKVEKHYKELMLNTEHFFEARMDLNIFLKKASARQLYEVHVRRPWNAFTMMINANAYYMCTLNSLVATAGILQEPFFSASVPSYLNYASIGFTVGHELTHAFDDVGREFDDEGELNEWWDVASLNKFNEKKQCIIDQYSSFIESVTGRRVNGINTQGENIADNGGLKLAYRAYRRVAEQMKKPEPGLPGLKQYNNDQLFFINFASVWCTKMPPQAMMHFLLTNVHAPSEWRINGAVMNMPQFGKIFGCDKGTPMNPEERCEVW